MGHVTRVGVVVLLAVCSGNAQQRPAEPPRFRVAVNTIEVAVSVQDARGAFVAGLQHSDFDLRVDGRVVPVEQCLQVDGPPASDREARFLVLVLDDVGMNPVLARRAKDIALELTRRMGPLDEAAVLGLNGDAMRSTRDRAAIEEAIERFQFFGAARAFGGGPRYPREHAMETIAALAQQMDSVDRRRKVIVVIGSSHLFDEPRPLPQAQDLDAWLGAVRTAAWYNVPVYLIDPRGLGSSSYDSAWGFASETGGLAFVNTNQFDRAVELVWSDITRYYLLGFAAPASGDEQAAHRLSVRVNRPDVQARARRTAR